MKTPARLLCLLLATGLPAFGQYSGYSPYPTQYVPSGPPTTMKAPTGALGFEVPIERVNHYFYLQYRTIPSGPVQMGSGMYQTGFITSGAGVGAAADLRSLLVTCQIPYGTYTYTPTTYNYTYINYVYINGNMVAVPYTYTYTSSTSTYVPFNAYEWWLLDSTTGQESWHNINSTPTASNDLRTIAWTTPSGVPNRYFAVPESRLGHGLIYGDPTGAWSAVSPGYQIGTYSNGTSGTQVPLHWFTASATQPANAAASFIADRTTDEKTVPGTTDVRANSAWSIDANYSIYPLVAVKVEVEAGEVGHLFTVHGYVPGAPPQLKNVPALAGATATANATLNFVIGAGMQFWVSRDAEDGAANQPLAPATGTWTANAATTFSALGRFRATPLRAAVLVPHQFTVNATPGGAHAGHTFTVRMSDGYSTVFGPVANAQTTAYVSGQIQNWLDDGTPHHLPTYSFTALLDPTRITTLSDNTTNAQLLVTITTNPTAWLDGWQRLHTAAPPTENTTITLQLPASRWDSFALHHAPPDTGISQLSSYLSAEFPDPFLMNGIDGMAPYFFAPLSLTFNNPTPYFSGPFVLEDLNTLETQPGMHAGLNDLSTWYLPPHAVALQISSSRWDHYLVLRHPNGESYYIQRGAVAGSTSAPVNLPPWYQNYYYFDATSFARSEMPWYVEDTDTGERLGFPTGQEHPNNSALINWIAVPPPDTLTGSINRDGNIDLQWPLSNLASPQGGFEVERHLTYETEWQQITTLPALTTGTDGLSHFTDANPVFGEDHFYRVRYTFGGQHSVPGNVFVIIGWRDSDGDDMPDWWETAHNLKPYDDTDPGLDADGDGFTNLYEYQHGTDPNDAQPVITLESGDEQETVAGAWLSQPLVVKVTRQGTNPPVPLENVSVTFAVPTGHGRIGTASQVEAPTPAVTLLTDATGHAQVWYHQPTHAWVRSRITATVISGSRRVQKEFHARTTTPPPPGGGGDPGPGDGDPADDPDGDWDQDGLTNAEEIAIGSEPENADSDDDGVPDGADAMPTDEEILFPRAGAPHYALIDIGEGSISALNGKGEAVGSVPAAAGSGADPVAFFWSRGTRKNLPGRKPQPRAVNDSGAIVGSAEFEVPGVSGTYNRRAAHWATADSEPTDLGSLGKITTTGHSEEDKAKKPGEWGTSEAVAINNAGMIMGESTHHIHGTQDPGVIDYGGGDSRKAVRFNVGGKPTLLGPGKKDDLKVTNWVIALSEGGVAVGRTEDTNSASGYTGAALWDNGTFSQDLGKDFTPTGITQAPVSDTHYKYYVVGTTTEDDPAPPSLAAFGGQSPSPASNAANGTKKNAVKLKSKTSGEIITKKESFLQADVGLPAIGEPTGISAKGLGFSRDTELWRNGKTGSFADSIAKPAGTTLDSIGAMTPAGLLGVGTFVASLAHGGIVYPVDIEPDANMIDVIGDKMKSAQANSKIKHFVTPQKSPDLNQDYVELIAVGVDASQFDQFLVWEGGAAGSAANKRKVSRNNTGTGPTEVKIKTTDGAILVDQMNVWIIWVDISATPIPISAIPDPLGTSISGGYHFTHTIKPADLTAANSDHPNLSGPYDTSSKPPDVPAAETQTYQNGTDLSKGADHKWDNTRRLRQKAINPSNINFGANHDPKMYANYPIYPSNKLAGNDDTTTADPEANDPYTDPNIGRLTGKDTPTLRPLSYEGNDGNTFEIKDQWEEFTRLQIGKKWYNVSDPFPWRLHFKFKKSNGQWEDNNSILEKNNADY